ncbi:hypothetical protein [Sporosarcina phage Lietuvens]|nr:hypothetical protein [Sporosarcina phage Lietuvens]
MENAKYYAGLLANYLRAKEELRSVLDHQSEINEVVEKAQNNVRAAESNIRQDTDLGRLFE